VAAVVVVALGVFVAEQTPEKLEFLHFVPDLGEKLLPGLLARLLSLIGLPLQLTEVLLPVPVLSEE
jgi:hypothetical protein